MDWLQLSFEVSGDDIEAALTTLEEGGAQATTQQNAGEDSYYDLAHPAQPKWDRQRLTGLFEDAGNREQLLMLISKQSFTPLNVLITRLEDQNWETAWLDQYQPVQITPELWIYPSWVSPDKEVGTIIKIDPGLAFGTGTHPTTRLCMRALADLNLDNKTVIDYGCGSGILAITAIRLGADSAVGVDIDEKAEAVAQENSLINGVSSQFTIQSAAEIGAQKFDLVIANILAFALIELAPSLIAYTQHNGTIILSGILAHQAADVAKCYGTHFKFDQYNEDEWVVLVGTKLKNH